MKDELEKRIKSKEDDFAELAGQLKVLSEKRKEIDQAMYQIQERQKRIDGAHKELTALLELEKEEAKEAEKEVKKVKAVN